MLQDSVLHNITQHLNGTAKPNNTESSAHIKSLEKKVPTFIKPSGQKRAYSIKAKGLLTFVAAISKSAPRQRPCSGSM